MFIRIKTKITEYSRLSKTGVVHQYTRAKTIAVFQCDECEGVIERDLKHVDKKRLSNNYFHCCACCNPKRFAQRKGIEQKKIWDMPASTTLPVGKY